MSLGDRLRRVMVGAIVVGVGACVLPAVASADSMSISLSSSTVATGTPVSVTIATTANPIDKNGDGPYLYAVVQPASAGSCQPTYGYDEQVVGSQATVLVSGGGDEVSTGQATRSFNFDAFTSESYTVCAWLESTDNDYAGSSTTSQAVSANATAGLQLQDTDTLTGALSSSTPRPNVPFTVTLSGSATPIDQSGDGPYLYAVVQPAGAGSCQPTYGYDEQVVGSQATVLVSGGGHEVSTGAFSSAFNFSAHAGSYRLCSWLESTDNDYAGSSTTSAAVLATATPITFSITAPPLACIVPRYSGATLTTVERRILAAHCTVGHIRRVHRRGVRRNVVVSLSPGPGTRRASRAAVAITVSLG